MKPDKLNREEYINLLKEIIITQSNLEKGYSIAIDGIWGSGKSYILDAITEKLNLTELDKPFLVFRYNCWENDFYEEPLIAILSVMIEQLNKVYKQKDMFDAVVTQLLKEALSDLEILISSALKFITKLDIEKSIKSKKGLIKRIKQDRKIENTINPLTAVQDTLKRTKETIKKLSEKFCIVVLIDELDRCLPSYAIKVLERIHHINFEESVISVIAIDKKQLADGISKGFGKEYIKYPDREKYTIPFADLYLQKFIDVSIPLGTGDLKNDEPLICEIMDNYVEYVRDNNLGQSLISLDKQFLISFYIAIFDGIDIRTQEKVLNQVSLCHNLTIKSGIELESYQYQVLIYELLTCISYFIFKRKINCSFRQIKDANCVLEFFNENFSTKTEYEIKYSKLNTNLSTFFNINIQNYNRSNSDYNNFLINDNRSFLVAYFSESKVRFPDPIQNMFREMIVDDKKFLNKFESIMKQLCV